MGITNNEFEQLKNRTLDFDKEVDIIQRIVDNGVLWKFDSEIYQQANYLIETGYVFTR